jgi:hypothetical protein
VECVKDGVVSCTGRADRVIGAVIDSEPLAVSAGKRKIVRTARARRILLPIVAVVVAHRAVELF